MQNINLFLETFSESISFLKVLYNIFYDHIKENIDNAFYTNPVNNNIYLYSGFICKSFLSSIERIINQIVGDIIRMKIMNFNVFNCSLVLFFYKFIKYLFKYL